MLVVVQMLGELQKYIKDKEERVEVPEGTTVGELAKLLGLTPEESWSAAMNGKLAYPEDPLTDGVVVMVFPPIAGG